LLIGLRPDRVARLLEELSARNVAGAVIGEVRAGSGIEVIA
jgi:hypothetical protein